MPLPGRARARLRMTRRDTATSSPRGAVSASAYDKVKAAAESARAELNAAKAQADVARNETSYAVLLADADGVVVETLAEPGQVVDAGQVVVRVAHAGRREAVIELPETLRPAIGSTGRATLYGSGADGLCETSPVVGRRKPSDSDVRGAVRAGGPSGRRAAGLDHLHPDPGRPVRPGAAGADRRDLRSGQGSRRMAGRRETPRVTWRAVQVAGLSDEAASVVGNLKAGDRVVALGAHLLHEGEHVRLAESEAAQAWRQSGGQP